MLTSLLLRSPPPALPPSPPELYGAGREQSLLQRHHPSLVRKLRELGVQPLQLAMPWIQFGFVTYLEADQASASHILFSCCVACCVWRVSRTCVRSLFGHRFILFSPTRTCCYELGGDMARPWSQVSLTSPAPVHVLWFYRELR